MKQIIITKPGSLKPEAIAHLLEHGVVVIEHENPEEVRVISPLDGLDANDLLTSMAKAINDIPQDSARIKFAAQFLRTLTKEK